MNYNCINELYLYYNLKKKQFKSISKILLYGSVEPNDAYLSYYIFTRDTFVINCYSYIIYYPKSESILLKNRFCAYVHEVKKIKLLVFGWLRKTCTRDTETRDEGRIKKTMWPLLVKVTYEGPFLPALAILE